MQNLLFVLGGLLLGAAAIVFAAVAWASFGVLGRAAILAVVTLLTLSVPPLVLRRGLRATGETFAALGLLLVVLDGYAAWYVDLVGLATGTIPTTYAGITFAVTAAVGGGYAVLTRLRAPGLAAVLALQPVLPLLALHRGFGATGWTFVFVVVAALDVALATVVSRNWTGQDSLGGVAVNGQSVQDSLTDAVANGPNEHGPRSGAVANGPNEHGVRGGGVAGGPNEHGVRGGGVANGPNEHDPRSGGVANGPNEHDPRSGGVANGPNEHGVRGGGVAGGLNERGVRSGGVVGGGFGHDSLSGAGSGGRGGGRAPGRAGFGPVAWVAAVAAGVAVLSALPPALHSLATVDGVPAALRIAGVMALLAALVVVTGGMHPATTQAGAGVAVVIVGVAGARLVAEVVPDQRYVAFGGLALLVAAVALVVPERLRGGARFGAAVVVSGFALPYALFAVYAALRTAALALPVWHLSGGANGLSVWDERGASIFGWQEPAALGLLAGAGWLLVRHRAVPWAALLLLTFALPAAFTAPEPVLAALVDGVVLAGIVAVVVLRAREWVAFVVLPFVAAHLAVVALVTPGVTVAGYLVLGVLAAVVTARVGGRGIGLPAAVVGLLTLPVAGAAGFWLLDVGTAGSGVVPPALAGATFGYLLVTGAALVLRNRAWNAGTVATAVAGAAVTVGATFVAEGNHGATWFGTYATAVLVCVWFAARGFRSPGAGADAAGPGGMPAEAAGPGGVRADAAGVVRAGSPGPDAAYADAAGGGVVRADVAWSGVVRADVDRLSAGWRGQDGAAGGAHASAGVVPVLFAMVSLLPAVAEVLLRPLGWLGAIWRGAPVGVGLGPDGTEWWAGRPPAFGAGASAVTLAVLALLAVLVAGRFSLARWSFAAPPVLLAAVLGCVAVGAPWPAVPAVTLATGIVAALGAALRRPSPGAVVAGMTCWFGIVPGLSGLLATSWSTILGLALIVGAGIVVGVAGRTVSARVLAWPIAGIAAAWLAFASGRAAELPLATIAYLVLGAAVLSLAGGFLLRGREGGGPAIDAAGAAGGGVEGRVLDVVAHAVGVVAFLLAIGDLAAAAGVAGLWGVALGLRALPASGRGVHASGAAPRWVAGGGPGRVAYVAGAVFAELVAYELVLVAREVGVAEAYTGPVAFAALVAGWFAARRNAALTSWTAFGPGLLAGLLPSLALVAVTPGDPGRRLVLGAVALAVVLAGARLRLKAPIAAGGVVLAVLAWHEVLLFWDYLPRWAPLAMAGAVLVGLAVTYERRIRDLTRLRDAMGRMR
ncbi:hypothetical protein [Dactylosporangium sp. NPDC049140]|uniref:SCO7613 C-terminal domain-containing membrane protein n=1 Tax=Dactylosporangium sp. NPDC049140 TaxID=3155647 RepID=UPI0033D6FE3C